MKKKKGNRRGRPPGKAVPAAERLEQWLATSSQATEAWQSWSFQRIAEQMTADGWAIGYQSVRNHLPFVIARQEKCLPSQVLAIRAERGCTQRRGPVPVSVEKIAVVRRLAAEGMPSVDIAFHEALSWQQVEKILREDA